MRQKYARRWGASDMRSELWETTTFGELIQRDALQINDGHRAKLAELGGDGPVFFRAGLLTAVGVDTNGADQFRDEVTIPEQKYARARDTFVTTKGNSVGRAGFMPHGLPPLVYSPHLSYWRSLDETVLHPEFMRYWALGPEFLAQLRAMAHGTDMAPYLSLVDQKRLLISLPPVAVQQRIAGVLGALDDKIDNNRRLAGLLEETAAALFRARFVDFVGVEEFDESEIGPVPVGSRVGEFSEVVVIHKASVQPSQTPGDLFEHFSIPAFDTGRLPVRETGAAMLSAKTTLPDGDRVLVSKLNPLTKRVWWPRLLSSDRAVCSPEFVVLTAREGVPSSFVYATCEADDSFYNQLLAHVAGTTGSRQRVKPTDVLRPKVRVPDSSELARWDLAAKPLYDLAGRLVFESQTLVGLRDALLPKLISGQIRVPDTTDPEEVIGPVAEELAV